MAAGKSTLSEKRAAQDEARARLLEHQGRKVFTTTDYGKGLTDYVRAFVAPAADQVREITFDLGRASGRRVTERGIALGGGGYSKALEVADDFARLTTGEAVDQLNGWDDLR